MTAAVAESSLDDADWDAWFEHATAAAVASAITDNGLLTSASVALGAAEILSEAWRHLDDRSRDQMLQIVTSQAEQLVFVLRDLVELGGGTGGRLELSLDDGR